MLAGEIPVRGLSWYPKDKICLVCLRNLKEASWAETKWPTQRERKIGEKIKEEMLREVSMFGKLLGSLAIYLPKWHSQKFTIFSFRVEELYI